MQVGDIKHAQGPLCFRLQDGPKMVTLAAPDAEAKKSWEIAISSEVELCAKRRLSFRVPPSAALKV